MTSHLHRPVLFLVAIQLGGCGSVFFDGTPRLVNQHASATVRVESSASVTTTEGGLVIVEQEAGQGFVMEGGLSMDTSGSAVASSGRDYRTSGWTNASGVSVDGNASGTGGMASSGAGGAAGDAAWVEASHLSSGAPGGVIVGTSSPVPSSPAASSPVPSSAVASSAVPSSTVASSSAPASSATVGASVSLELAADVPRDGVWGVDGRATALSAIVDRGVQVDGVRVSLAELEALANLGIGGAADTRLATDGAIEAWAELEHDTLPRTGGETHVVVRVRAPSDVRVPRGRLRVHLVIDRSSSMQSTWPRVLESARLLIGRLEADDELQIVAYGTDAVEAWPIHRVGNGRAAIAALENISVGGGTNIEAGLRLAYDRAAHADASARGLVILLSDGVPNHGAFEPREIGDLAAHACVSSAVTTSVIGLGTEFDARLLRTVARRGRGGYHVSATVEGLTAGLVAELEAHARSAASQVSLRVTLPAGVELLGVADGDAGAERTANGVTLSMPHLDAGEERSVVLSVRVAAHGRASAVAQVELGYRSGVSGRAVSATKDLEVSFGPRAVLREDASAGLLDADLASALDAAGRAILDGDARAAASALNAHAALAEGRAETQRSPRARARVRVVHRLATAVGALLPSASHSQRRQVGLAFGGLAARLGR